MVSGKRSGADSAQKFLGDQIKDYERRLSDAEQRLAEFKKKNVGLVPGEQGDYFSRLQAEMAASKKAESALEVAQRRRAELDRQLNGEHPFTAASAGGTKSSGGGLRAGVGQTTGGGEDTASRIAEAQARLDDLLLRYTDKHPDVVAARETLAQLKARQAAELEALKRGDASGAAGSGLSANPVYQSIQLQMNQADVEIAALRGELADHQRSEAELKRVVNSAPEIEAEFARLTRDYNVEKAQYNALVERLEKAKLSEDAADTGIVQFQIINPPTSDPAPVAPKRPLLLALVFLGAIGLGVGVAWLLAQIRPVFTNARTLADLTGLPVLGSVHRTWLEQYNLKIRRGLYKLAGAAIVLLIGFVAILALSEPTSKFLHELLPIAIGGA
jgi:polysaccharide chain length determinant protein (PEP-CTERM system associated)